MSSIKLKGSSSGEATITTASDGSTVNVDKNLVLPAGQNFCIGATDDVVIGRATDDRMTFNTGGTERARIDENGKVGIGTSTPSYKLSLQDSNNLEMHLLKTSVSDAWVRNIGNMDIASASGGASGQVITFSNGANYAGLAERMRIDGSGQVYIGTTVERNNSFVCIKSDATNQNGMEIRCHANNDAIRFYSSDSTSAGAVTVNGSSTTYSTSSDYRLKENVDYTFDATTRLKQLKPCRFNWIADDTNTELDGFIAHEVSSIVPEAIIGEKDDTKDLGTITETLSNVIRNSSGDIIAQNVSESDWTAGKVAEPQLYPSDSTWKNSYDNVVTENAVESEKEDGQTWVKTATENVYQGIDQSKLVPLLVKTIQEQQAVIEDLQSRVTTLEG